MDARNRERVGRHLAACERCRADLAAIRSVAGAFANSPAPAVEPAADLWARVSARIVDDAPQPVRRSWLRSPQIVSAAAATVVVVALGISMMRSGPIDERPAAPNRLADAPPIVGLAESQDREDAPRAKTTQPEPSDPAFGTESEKTITVDAPGKTRPSRELSRETMVAEAPAAPPAPSEEMDRVVLAPSRLRGPKVFFSNGHAEVKAVDELHDRPAPPSVSAGGDDRYYADVSAADSDGAKPDAGPSLSYRTAASLDGPFTDAAKPSTADHLSIRPAVPATAFACGASPATASVATERNAGDSVVDALNETEGVRTAALFTYP